MASNNESSGSGPSAAQMLLQKHSETHTPQAVNIEDVPDVDLPAPAHDASGSWAAPVASKDSVNPKNGIDTKSHELFPELGGPKSKNASVAPIWGAKNVASEKPNGAGSNGVSRSSTPVSGIGAATPAMSIPGRNVESVTLEPQFVMPRNQLKRPIPDILKDLNRKSRANVTMATAPNGRLKFEATGPQDVAQQALKDLVAQIGARVSTSLRILATSADRRTDLNQSIHPELCPLSHHWQRRYHDQDYPRQVRS